MKIISLQLSNIVSFKHVDNIDEAHPIPFDDNLNIIIGENGSGKSTALEVINFLFKRVIYKQYIVNQDLFGRRTTLTVAERKNTVTASHPNTYAGFRLEPNWTTPTRGQQIRLVIKLDDIDRANIALIQQHFLSLNPVFDRYTNRQTSTTSEVSDTYTLDVIFEPTNRTFSVQFPDGGQDFGYEYLAEYNFYKEAIAIYNADIEGTRIPPLSESFTIISSYRNYSAFNTSISLRDALAPQQIQQLNSTDYGRSLNTTDNAEPSIFAIVRLRVADKHYSLLPEGLNAAQREAAANDLPFLKSINDRLKIVNLSCRIKLLAQQNWQYSFEFVDLRRGVTLADINSLSAGQKAIVHLVFEAYGRGDIEGGVVIIDEPEIHLHYQFQHEYLQAVRELNRDQKCQYLIVTHSEALINSSTINSVRRFSLSSQGSTEFHCPTLDQTQKALIKILDNTRSTYAFFAKKVLLVEGDSDRYFYRAALQAIHPRLDQEVAILHVGSKTSFHSWTTLFEAFGLTVHRIADFDYCHNCFYNGSAPKLTDTVAVAAYKTAHPDVIANIDGLYPARTYILKNGDLEHYLGIRKDLTAVIEFCQTKIDAYLTSGTDEAHEIRTIIDTIANLR
jgi:predicted ATP-dependent endonuclease of OLD family